MSEWLNINYECLNSSCQVFCKKGAIKVTEEELKELSEGREEGTFRTPYGICRMGFNQIFKIKSIEKVKDSVEIAEIEPSTDGKDPLIMLSSEHQVVLKRLDLMENQVRRRDLEGLWASTAHLENDIILHAIKKEEESLFPCIENRFPMGPPLIGVMKEDHREFISLLHGFRCSLQEGDILDGFVNSVIVNLRNHIRKEDEEFFPLINQYMDKADKEKLLAEMMKLEGEHRSFEPGDRIKKPLIPYSPDRGKLDAQIMVLKDITHKGGEACCH